MPTELSQAELLAWRLVGRLPHIDINGTDFTIDIRLQELRETESPWNAISLVDMETGLDTDDYVFFYDTRKHNLYELPDDLTKLPGHVVWVELPNELVLDPIAAARAVGYSEDFFLAEYPLQQNMKAGIKQLSDTFLPDFVEVNRQRQQTGYRR